MMEGQAEHSHHLLSFGVGDILEQNVRRWGICCVYRLRDEIQVLAFLSKSSPGREVGFEIGQHEIDSILSLEAEFFV